MPRDAPVIRALCCVSVIGMTPSRSRVRIDRIDLDLVYYTLHMSMGKRVRERQPEMWVATTNFPTAASHPLYTRLNQRLAEHYFDDFVEGRMDIPVAKVRKVLKIAQEPISLETPIGEEEDSHLGDFIEDRAVVSPAEAVI